jgi:hypothetical protein
VRSWKTTSFIFHIFMTLFMLLKNTWLFHSFSPIHLRQQCTSVTCILS